MTHLRATTDGGGGYMTIKELVAGAKAGGHARVALLNRTLFGLPKFLLAAEAAGVEPVIGCEVPIAKPDSEERGHVALYARDAAGYANLCQLATMGASAAVGIPTLSLVEHAEGLLLLDGGRQGPFAPEDWAAGEGAVVRESFAGRMGLEVSRTGDAMGEAERDWNARAAKAARELRMPIVATHPCAYVNPEDAEGLRLIRAVKSRRALSQMEASWFEGRHLPSEAEMAARFSDVPQAVRNAEAFAETAAFRPALGGMALPDLGGDPDRDLAQEARRGLARRLGGKVDDAHRERLEHELGIIRKLGFSSYFLIVADYVSWAKRERIGVGSGRGSAVGSLVAYSIGITALDPIQHGLIFERFLNPERVSPPDIDVDFAPKDRHRVLNHVIERYGHDRVAQVGTATTFALKSAVRDAARAHGMALPATNRLVASLGDGDSLDDALMKAGDMSRSAALPVLESARRLGGRIRQTGTHPGAVVVSKTSMRDYLPSQPNAQAGGLPVLQGDGDDVERLGLVKLDLLGLDGLDARDLAAKAAKVDLEAIPMDDPQAMAIFAKGETSSIFQFGGDQMRRYMAKLKPTKFEQLVAMTSLYRPGPMEYINNYIRRSQGKEEVTSPHEAIAPMLEETLGIVVYQEQVMQVAMVLAGMTPAQADSLRRAMGKKKPEEMASQRTAFIAGAEANGVSSERAGTIFDVLAKFSGYGFNKSHAAAYAMLAYQDAYLLAHYPAAFVTGKLSSAQGNPERLGLHMRMAERMGVTVLRPSVGRSVWDFRCEADGVRIGFSGVRGVGPKGAQAILAARQAGPFASFDDFMARVSPNKGLREALLQSGALDDFGPRESIEAAIETGSSIGLDLGGSSVDEAPSGYRMRRALGEVQALGRTVSGHPFDGIEGLHGMLGARPIKDCHAAGDADMRLCGIVQERRKESSRRGVRIHVALSDGTGTVVAALDEKALQGRMDGLEPGSAVVVAGALKSTDGEASMRGTSVEPLADALSDKARWLSLSASEGGSKRAHQLLEGADPGPCKVAVQGGGEASVMPTLSLLSALSECGNVLVAERAPDVSGAHSEPESSPSRSAALDEARAAFADSVGALRALLAPSKASERTAEPSLG